MKYSEQIIKQIKDFNLNDPYSYERLVLYFELNKLDIPTLTFLIPKGTLVFRSRENFEKLFFTNVSEIDRPPKECVMAFNRANRPNQSLFYCSDKREISYSEFMEDWKSRPFGSIFNITVGVWEILRDINVHLILDRKNLCKDFDSIKGEKWNDDLTEINDFLVDTFMTSAYCNKQIYVLTSAISNILLLRSGLDGILYPSIPTNGFGLNLALNPNISTLDYLNLKHITRDTFVTIKNKNFIQADHLNILSLDGEIDYENGTIYWHKIPSS